MAGTGFSENRLLELLRDRHSSQNSLIRKGIGDDCAVVRPKGARELWAVTTDMLAENVDFRREWISPCQLGCKALAVNLSDLAAMGARPRFFTVSLAMPSGIREKWVLDFHDGLAEKGRSLGAHLIGGDLSRSENGIVISITAVGESLNRKLLYRSGGKPGDILYVTGVLGKSAAGLKLLQNALPRARSSAAMEALQAHRTPEPRCEAGLWLAQSGLASCMMDLSDGLSMDLPRLCAASAAGAEIRNADLPVFGASSMWGCDPVELALHGGEDFELLFAVPKLKSTRLENTYPAALPRITKIGELTGYAGKVLMLRCGKRRRLPRLGHDHFARRRA